MTATTDPNRGAARTAPAIPPATGEEQRARIVTGLLHALVWATTLFNFVLCFVDTNIVTLSPREVMASEALLLAAAVALPFAMPGRRAGRWDLLLAVMLVNWLLLSILRGFPDPKLFRDLAIIPIFVMAGLASRGGRLHVGIFWLHILILAVAAWEAFALDSFVSIFSVARYFEHTRGLQADDWWISNGLYLSSVRPEARFLFPELSIHRLSSVFLEPVSLGNYVVIATLWLTVFWRRLPPWMVVAGAFTNLLLLVGSDSRLGFVACLLILGASLIGRWLPAALAILVAPVVLLVMFLAVGVMDWRAGIDDFPGRVAHSVGVFRSFTFADYTGVSLAKLPLTADAGFAYLVNAHAIWGAIILWLFLFAYRPLSREGRAMLLGTAIYLSLNLVISWSLLSVKTAGLLWFLFGRALASDRAVAVAVAEADQVDPAPNSAR